MQPSDLFSQAHRAFAADDAQAVRDLLNRHAQLRAAINAPIGPFDSPAIVNVRSRAMLDVLLDAGADINAKSKWWAGGFGLLHCAAPELARYAIERGATVDVHAAARLSLMAELQALLSRDPQLVHAPGGDGQTPLHFAGSVEIAELLLRHGAAIDALDVDHESTPAQYMVRERQDVARFLVARGCRTDLLMAAALGDIALAAEWLQRDPDCIRLRVSDEFFPMVGGKAGGTIYQWTLGWHVSAHQVARQFGHADLFDLLMRHTPDEMRLTVACWLHDEAAVDALLTAESCSPRRADPLSPQRLAELLPPSERRQLAHAARNNDAEAARLMLKAGLPLDEVSQHGATALHWAAFHGNADLTRLLLSALADSESSRAASSHSPSTAALLARQDADFHGTPLGWAIHGSENCWDRDRGDHAATVTALLDAGALPPSEIGGSAEVSAVLAARRASL